MTAKTTKKPVREENKVRAGTRDNKSEASENKTDFPDKISEHPRHCEISPSQSQQCSYSFSR